MLKLTRQMIFDGRSARGGWTRHQLALLGVAWPPLRGWLDRLDGTSIDPDKYRAFLAAKNRRELNRAKRKPTDYPELFSAGPEQTETIEPDA